MGHQEWLDAPWEQRCAEQDSFVAWAEEEGYDLEDPASSEAAEDAYNYYIEGNEEDVALARYEAYQDRIEMEYEEREDWDY